MSYIKKHERCDVCEKYRAIRKDYRHIDGLFYGKIFNCEWCNRLDDAWEQYNKDKLVNKEWKVKEEEYKIVDTDINKVGDTPTEEVKKWREKNEKEKN